MSAWIKQLRQPKLSDLMATDREQRAYQQGIEKGKRSHDCPKPEKVAYPHEIVSALDDLADVAFEQLGDAAYQPVRDLHEWLRKSNA